MNYLFTNEKVKLGDICIILCDTNQLTDLHVLKYFPKYSNIAGILNKVGIKVTHSSKDKCKGYMVHIESKKIKPYLFNGKLIYLHINTSNIAGIMKFNKNDIKRI